MWAYLTWPYPPAVKLACFGLPEPHCLGSPAYIYRTNFTPHRQCSLSLLLNLHWLIWSYQKSFDSQKRQKEKGYFLLSRGKSAICELDFGSREILRSVRFCYSSIHWLLDFFLSTIERFVGCWENGRKRNADFLFVRWILISFFHLRDLCDSLLFQLGDPWI